MTPVSFVKTTESYEVSLGTINRQTSFDSGILRQDYGLIRGLPMNHSRFFFRLDSTFIGADQNGWVKFPHPTSLCRPCIAAFAGLFLFVCRVHMAKCVFILFNYCKINGKIYNK